VRDFGRRGATPSERASRDGDGAKVSVIRRRPPLGLELLEDKEGALDGTLCGEWAEGLEEPERWERRDWSDLAERAETREELLRECLRTCRSVRVHPEYRFTSGFGTRLDTMLGNDVEESEDDWTRDGADTMEDAMGRADGGF
jgi:hypothetical protein